MPPDVTVLDYVAFAWMIVLWGGYALLLDHALRRRGLSLNAHMDRLREAWMRRMLQRDVRIMDSQLVGHSINSVTFFASTTMIVIAALVGVMGGLDHTQRLADTLAFVRPMSPGLLEIKLVVLLAIFVIAFLNFTWALRQYNYCCVLIGSAPTGPLSDAEVHEVAAPIGGMMSLAMRSFNGGLRAYYFAVGTLAWFIEPWLYLVASTVVVAILLRRQVWSTAYQTIQDHGTSLNDR